MSGVILFLKNNVLLFRYLGLQSQIHSYYESTYTWELQLEQLDVLRKKDS